jgi:hypothetical protein
MASRQLRWASTTYDEEILTLEARDVLEGSLNTLSDFALVLIDSREIQVTVASLQGVVDSLTDLTGGRLPGTKTQLTVGSGVSY